MSDHLKKTKTGVIWSFIDRGGTQVLNLLVIFVLARLVTPEEFGTVAMITVFTNFAIRFVDFGFSAALIYKKNIDQDDINTVFFFNLIVAVILSLLFYFLSPVIANFYGKSILEILTKVMCVIFIITSLTGVNKSLITKELKFKLNTKIFLAAFILSSVLAIILAYLGFGVWSILVKILSQEAFQTLFFLVFYPVHQKPVFKKKSFTDMFKMGRNVAGTSLINYWSRNADNLLIGKMLGGGALGIYSKAYAVMLLPLTNFSRVISKVMFPSFSLINENIPEIRRIYLSATRVIAFLTFPLMGGLAIVSREFVLVTFGPEWSAMIPLISILAVLGATQSILSLNGTIFYSLGKSHIAFRLTLIFGVINVLGFFIGIRLGGLVGLALIYTGLGVVGAIPKFYFAGRLIKISVLEMFRNLSNPMLYTTFMMIILYAFKLYLNRFGLSPVFELLMLTILGGLLYLAMAIIGNGNEYKLVKKFLINKKKGK